MLFIFYRHIFNAILDIIKDEIYVKISEKLKTHLEATGMPPITADKATINRRTNQTILVYVNINGKREVFPIGCPLVNKVLIVSYLHS